MPENHPKWSVTFGQGGGSVCGDNIGVIDLFRLHKPGIIIFENVKGFAMHRRQGRYMHQTPLDEFSALISSIQVDADEVVYTGSVVLMSDSHVWLGSSRPRCVIVVSCPV